MAETENKKAWPPPLTTWSDEIADLLAVNTELLDVLEKRWLAEVQKARRGAHVTSA